MSLEELKDKMSKGVVEFKFKKVDGTVRVAHGTLNSKYFKVMPKGTGRASEAVCPYWDMDKDAWRCFKIDSLVNE